MISTQLLQELKAILEKKYGRKLTPEEVSEAGRIWTGYFELARQVEKDKLQPKEVVIAYYRKFSSVDELRKAYGKIHQHQPSVNKGAS